MGLKATTPAFSRYLFSYVYKSITPASHQQLRHCSHNQQLHTYSHLQTNFTDTTINKTRHKLISNWLTIPACFTLFTLNISSNREEELGRPTDYPDRLHDFSFTIPRYYKDAYVNSFFSRTTRLWNPWPPECFPLTYDLNGFKLRANSHHLYLDSL